MKFHEYRTMYSIFRASWRSQQEISKSEFIDRFPDLYANKANLRQAQNVAQAEFNWETLRRPYYSVYPCIANSLVRLDLEALSGDMIIPPLDNLLVRFPVGNEFDLDGSGAYKLKYMMLAHYQIGSDRHMQVMTTYSDESITLLSIQLCNTSLQQQFDKINFTFQSSLGRSDPKAKAVESALKLACTICLLGDNPDLIKPDVLDNDRLKYEETGDCKYVERAQRRGKVGWVVGAEIERDSHFRRPHLAWRHTGKGRTIPRIVPVKGCIVNPSKLTAVPQGYLDDLPVGANA